MKEIARAILKIFLIFVKKIIVFMPSFPKRLLLKEAEKNINSISKINENELISIIVPIYNVDRYLKRCINSIINQTYKNLEIILVDDGSTDKSSQICDEYKERDSRVIVIHKENGGLSSARNKGLDIAKGSLIGFVDSDDYINLTMYERLKSNMDKYNSDIVACRYCRKYKCLKEYTNKLKNVFEKKEKFNNMEDIRIVAWNKLYKKCIFENIRYPDAKIYEDNFIICDILNAAKKVSFVNEILYYYVMRKSSITKTYTLNHVDEIDAMDARIDYFKKHKYVNLRTKNEYNKVMRIIIYACKMNIRDLNDERISQYIEDATKLAKKLKDSKYLNNSEKNNINLFLQDKEKFYKTYKFKADLKKYIKSIMLYK